MMCAGTAACGPTLPTWAVQQVGGNQGYTGRGANVVAKAARDPKPTSGRFADRNLRLWLGTSSRTVKDPARTRGRHRTVFEYDLAVDDHDWNALGILLGIIQRGGVAHACGIEHDEIGFHAFPDRPAIAEPEP